MYYSTQILSIVFLSPSLTEFVPAMWGVRCVIVLDPTAEINNSHHHIFPGRVSDRARGWDSPVGGGAGWPTAGWSLSWRGSWRWCWASRRTGGPAGWGGGSRSAGPAWAWLEEVGEGEEGEAPGWWLSCPLRGPGDDLSRGGRCLSRPPPRCRPSECLSSPPQVEVGGLAWGRRWSWVSACWRGGSARSCWCSWCGCEPRCTRTGGTGCSKTQPGSETEIPSIVHLLSFLFVFREEINLWRQRRLECTLILSL